MHEADFLSNEGSQRDKHNDNTKMVGFPFK